MRTEKIIAVKKIGKHCYDDSQCETAIYAKSDSRPRYRWYVGYGADFQAANKMDIAHISDYDKGYAPNAPADYIGEIVRLKR